MSSFSSACWAAAYRGSTCGSSSSPSSPAGAAAASGWCRAVMPCAVSPCASWLSRVWISSTLQHARDRLRRGAPVEDHHQQRNLGDLQALRDGRCGVDVDQTGQEAPVVRLDRGHDLVGVRRALGHPARRVEHQHDRSGHRRLEHGLEVLLADVEGVRRPACGRRAGDPAARRRGRRSTEPRQVDGARTAERLLRHGRHPREARSPSAREDLLGDHSEVVTGPRVHELPQPASGDRRRRRRVGPRRAIPIEAARLDGEPPDAKVNGHR